MRAVRVAPFALAYLLTACAAGPGALPAPSPQEIPDLEALVASDPSDPDAALLLASAYRGADRGEDALRVVATARAAAPEAWALVAVAGLLHEDAGDLAAARDAYRAFLDAAPAGALRDEVSERLEHVRRAELRADVRAALEREAQLADTPPDPAAVGIFPFAYEGDDPTWAPLGPALAELLVTDLGITGRLTVLERVKVQALVDELALAGAGLVEESTAARGGRLLGSGHVVQGRYRIEDGGRLGIAAAVVTVGASGVDRVQPVEAADAVERLFDVEKELALDLHAELGIELTPAERARVNERQTESVQALLAFGRGLAAADAGDFQAAERSFAEAAAADPGFELARARRAQASAAGQIGADRLTAQAARLAQRRRAVQALRTAPAALRQHILRNITDRQRAALAEVLGQDRLGSAILLELVFRRPGGSR